MTIYFSIDQTTNQTIADHLTRCEDSFVPPLRGRVEIAAYAHKIASHAKRFEAWENHELVGLVAAYCNGSSNEAAFITSVSVLPKWQRHGIASRLMLDCLAHVRTLGFATIELETDHQNEIAYAFYVKYGFDVTDQLGSNRKMRATLTKDVQMAQFRDFNAEIRDTEGHQYAYSFDFDIMHPYMIRSFEPFFRHGDLLELGSFKGDFTRRLFEYFDDITCVEGSGEAIAEAKSKLGDRPIYIHSRVETALLPKRYHNVVLTHVLEHLDDPVGVLKRIHDDWLSDEGYLFLVCPNANAPSRQIAVKMGLISHNTAVTPAEAAHGHRVTYTLDTLESDVMAAGLDVLHRSGIFFKALANFQWDKILKTDIVTEDYLEGCYKLGQVYPDLCSSIFLVCKKRKII